MAVIVRRRSWGGVLPLGRHTSISGSSLIHCVSVSMAPPHLRGAKRLQSEPVQARTGPRAGEHQETRKTRPPQPNTKHTQDEHKPLSQQKERKPSPPIPLSPLPY